MSKRNVPNVVSICSVSSGSRRRSEARPSGRNLKLEIEYDGTNYCGWQVQKSPQLKAHPPQKKSIQEVIETTLQAILQEDVRLFSSGRTDAGVHAKAQIANFKTKSKLALKKLQRALNGLLPDDISVSKIEEKGFNFHSRFAAKSKVYRYYLLNRAYPSALLRERVYFYPYSLDVELMRKEALCLKGRHNFRAFCSSANSLKNTTRTVKRISIVKLRCPLTEFSLIAIDIEADGFLYNMARSIVGTLLEVGRGKLKVGDLKKILMAEDRKKAGPTAPAHGLCLNKVKY